MNDGLLIIKMTEYFASDPKRIQHFMKVYAFASAIGAAEYSNEEQNEYQTLCTAAIVHDIGIKPAEEKYGKGYCGGDLQQKLGIEPAREMLGSLGVDEKIIERVCFLIAHHHTYNGIDSTDWQILIEADFIVNAYEDNLPQESILRFRNRIFRTKTGIAMLNNMFGLD